MAWWTGQPTYGSNPVSKFIRENFAYLKTYTDYILNSGVTTADLAAVHASPPSLAAVVNITVNTTIGDTDVRLGGGYNISAGIVLTINGAFSAPLSQIFFGTGTVAFGVGSVSDIYPEWWGIDGISDDVQINQAIQAAYTGSTVWLSGAYNITSAITLNKTRVSLKSESVYGSSLLTASDINGIVINARYVDISNIFIRSTFATPTTSAGVLLVDSGSEIVGDCRLTNIFVQNFAYGLALYSSTALGISYNEIVGCWSYQAKTASIAITANGVSAWVTENHFWGGWLTASVTGCCIYISGGGPGTEANQNVFNAMCFQGGDPNQFAITDYGTNVVCNCRFEVDGHGMYVYNASAGARSMSRYYSNLYGLTAVDKIPLFVRGGVAYTDTWFGEASLNGLVLGVDVLNTTVDVNSNAGQPVLSVAATTGLFIGSPIIIDEAGTPEYHMVASVNPGVSITLEANLINNHTAVDAHTVRSWGCFYGQVCWPQEDEDYTNYFAKGKKCLTLDASVDAALGYKGIGVRSESGGMIKRSYENTLTLAGASTDFGISLPAGTKLLGAQFRVDTLITSVAGVSWSAAFVGGSTTALVAGQAFAQNTRASGLIVPEIATNVTNIRITPNAGTFTGGVLSIICYYEDTVIMSAV